VRRFSTLVSLSLVLVSPALRAQSTTPVALTACLTCHGPASEAASLPPDAAPIPRVGGQHAEYLVKQLRDFKAGKRRSDLMVPMLAKIGNRQLRELAAHFASQVPALSAAENSQLAERGRALYEQGNTAAGVPACVGCHLPNGVGAPRYPRLAGQRQAYVVQQLTNFKKSARTNDRAHVMRSIAANLSDEEMRAVAEYVAGLY
jgi:cytochrome c553